MNTTRSSLKDAVIISSSGVTLVEIVIVLALLGIVFTSIFSFFSFSADTFNKAQTKSDMQNDALLAAEFITRELRTATVISLASDEIPIPKSDLYNSCLGLKKGYIKYYYKDKIRLITNGSIQQLSLSLNKNTNILEFSIIAGESEDQYRINSKISLVNLEELPNENSSGAWVHYYSPFID
ncbi:MAG: prepilin-type N-terminal cleavage/methylation domain-containing protein [Clostridiales bacterium]|nr:prepilin-type N-terminal cleavage/methylation domain-containing protein [Clostridiales bacterium]